jgi:hypothetical protein
MPPVFFSKELPLPEAIPLFRESGVQIATSHPPRYPQMV